MAGPQEMVDAFIAWCDGKIAEIQAQLEPLEKGQSHSGHRGADTGFEWVDTTELTVQRLRNDRDSLKSAIERAKRGWKDA